MTYDVVIVGAGPTGLYAAYYAGFRGLRVALVDALPELGGQVAALYPEKVIGDVAGFTGIKGQDLVRALVDQAGQFGPELVLGESVVSLTVTGTHVDLACASGTVVRGSTVLIAGGVGNFTPRRLAAVEPWIGRGARYFVPALDELSGQDVLVVGGGDSAFDWALALHDLAASVTLIHRRDRFGAHEALVTRCRELGVPMHTPYEVDAVHGGAAVERVDVRHRTTGEVTRLDVQAVVAALGFVADLGPIRGWGLRMRDRGIDVDPRMRTSLPRVFAAGDIAEYEGKVKLIAVGFGEAATAVNHAATIVDPGAELFPGHSTNVPSPV